MIFSSIKHNHYKKFLGRLPKFSQDINDISIIFRPKDFYRVLLKEILSAKKRIYILALYLENDEVGQSILSALYQAKKNFPKLEINIFVDWHRAQRQKIGSKSTNTNQNWYLDFAIKNKEILIPIYGVPVHKKEIFGIFHLKGFIIDDTLLYSGVNINNVYFHYKDVYRYDRYVCIKNSNLAHSMLSWIDKNLKSSLAVTRFDINKKISKKNIRHFRNTLRIKKYECDIYAKNTELSITPLIGLGKSNFLNKTINNLIMSTEKKITICTPYFNLPSILISNISFLLKKGIKVEFIVGDKTASDFYTADNEPFKIISALPYFYEINLRHFIYRFQCYINKTLIIRLWKKEKNSFHLKGMWIDKQWLLMTSNNFNLRSWRLDLENAILIHDPLEELAIQRSKELSYIRNYTHELNNIKDLENISDYPIKIRKFLQRLYRIHAHRIIRRIL